MAKRNSKKQSEKAEIKGLGDVIEKVAVATGIKKAVKLFSDATGIDCGCDERKEKLNAMFPKRKPECLTADEYEFIGYIKDINRIVAADQKRVNEIYNRVFKEKVMPTGCGSCINNRINALAKVWETYEA